MKRGAHVVVRYADLAAHPTGDPGTDARLVVASCPGYYYGYRMMQCGARRIRTLILACTRDDDGELGGWNTIPATVVLSIKEIHDADPTEETTVRP